jgi:hypothetical protein
VSVLYPEQASAAVNKHLLMVGGSNEQGPARVDEDGIKISSHPDVLSFMPWRKSADQTRLAADLLIASPSPAGFISEFASPYERDTTVVSFRARTPAGYSDLEQFFAENTHLSDIHGNLSLLQDGQLHSFTLKAQTYSYGNLRWDERWRTWAEEHYWAMPLLLLFVAVILGSQLNAWLEARVRLRLECRN